MQNSGNFVTIATYTYPYECAVIRGRLESEGIKCFLKDEMTIQVHPFYSNAIGGIKLQVHVQDAERARTIISSPVEADPESLDYDDAATLQTKVVCSHCGSRDIRKKLPLRTFAFSVLLLGFPLLFSSRWFHCFSCDRDFKN